MRSRRWLSVAFFFLISLSQFGQQDAEVRDKALQSMSSVVFADEHATIRRNKKAFEDRTGVKLQFKVEDASFEKLGGLSEHLLRLFQEITSLENIQIRAVTGQFSALQDGELSEYLRYTTQATPDLAGCELPPDDSGHLDSLYNHALSSGFAASVTTVDECPESINGLCGQAAADYENILARHTDCPGIFNNEAYEQHVINTRGSRHSSWTTDANAISNAIGGNYILLGGAATVGTGNSGSTGVNLGVSPAISGGKYVINRNNSVNTCTERDMDLRCRMLFKRTGIRFIYVTSDLDYFLPQDSMDLFAQAATATFSSNTTDDIIVALYLKMSDGPVSSSNLLVKQLNGSWLTNADINYARLNTGGTYKAGTFHKFEGLFKNIPKPLTVCLQEAKVNGLLSTMYLTRQSMKGSAHLYVHQFRVDKAFDDLKSARAQLARVRSFIYDTPESPQAYAALAGTLEEETKLLNRIKLTYIRSCTQPQFVEADYTFKDIYLQDTGLTRAAAVKYLKDRYDDLFPANRMGPLAAGSIPDDIAEGSCLTPDNSDAIGDALNLSALLLSPTGLDIIPDALSAVYYAATDRTLDCFLSLASMAVPLSINAIKTPVTTAVQAVEAMNKGRRLMNTSTGVVALWPDPNLVVGAYKLESVTPQLAAKLKDNPSALTELLNLGESNAQLMSHVSEKLTPAKRIEFIEKAIDEPAFLANVKADPDEVLRWGGFFIENILDDQKFEQLAKNIQNLPGPQLPPRIAATFSNSVYVNRKLAGNETLYKYHGESNRTGKKYSWLTNKKYTTEAELREKLAIRSDWGVVITQVTEFDVPSQTWISEGKAAAQGEGYPGGDYQAVVSNLPRSWIVRSTNAF